MQQFYSALWDYAEDIRSGKLSLTEANRKCRQDRDAEARKLRKAGRTVFCFTMSNQTREYWGFDDPCGLSCPAYGFNISPVNF